MSNITIERRNFNDGSDKKLTVPCDAHAIVRASIAAGRNPMHPPELAGEEYDRKARENRVRSAVDLSGNHPQATENYLEARSTNQGHMTEAVADAFCAFTADAEFNVPWLMNIEELNRYSPQPVIERSDNDSRKRTDFIGQDQQGGWYVFEAKGRKKKPSATDLTKWKDQAKTIKTVNNIEPKHHIVAVTYLNSKSGWEHISYDPPVDERALAVEFDNRIFFAAYYMRLNRRIRPYRIVDETPNGYLYSIGIKGFQVGVHKDFEKAAFEGEIGRLFNLSSSVSSESGVVGERHAGLRIFGDGIMVRMMED